MSVDFDKFIEDHLEGIDVTFLVKAEIQEQVRGDIARAIGVIVREQIEDIITTEINIALASPIQLNDGFSRGPDYGSFEEFFKAKFQEKMNKTYEIKKQIASATSAAVNKMFTDKYQDAVDKIVAELTK